MDEDKENNGNGQKSMVKTFLSLEIWQPLGKLTFVMYLIHYIVYLWWQSELETPIYYSDWNEWLLAMGIWATVALWGLLLWFVVEKPLGNMVTMLLALMMGAGKKKAVKAKYEPVRRETGCEIDDEHSINAAPAPQDL